MGSDVDLTEAQAAVALGVTARRVRQLVEEGVLVRSRPGRIAAVASWRSWREYQEAQRSATDESLEQAELRLTQAKADQAEEHLAILRRDHVPVGDAEAQVSRAASEVVQKLRAIPGAVARRAAGRPAPEVARILREKIAACLGSLSAIRVRLVEPEQDEVAEDGGADGQE